MFRQAGALLCIACAWSAGAGAFAQSIHIESGSYGANCGAREGNVTRDLAARCNTLVTCRFAISSAANGTNAGTSVGTSAGTNAVTNQHNCPADLVAEWSCGQGIFHRAMVRNASRHNGTLVLTCVPSTGAGK
ncbi:hypothetical protein [Paraburkholderia sp.]|uniref:hypothetical protein n=1 Tax=Paraburkholderia sp. TaxID=1926495 RepID=UPI0025D10D3B|nr:hypothetical protein [Paraburkholderia sp.]